MAYFYEDESRGKPVAPFQAAGVGMMQRLRLDPAGLFRLRQLIRKEQPDVLHCHTYYTAAGALALRAMGLRVPILYTVHANLLKGAQRSDALVRKVLRACDLVAAVSWKTAETVEQYTEDTRVIQVIPNGLDLQRVEVPHGFSAEAKRQSIGISKGTTVHCSVAALTKQKDHPTLFRAFAKLIRDGHDAVLVVIGAGAQRQALEELARDLKIHDSLRFLGKRDDVREWLAASHVFVLASHGEGMPISIVEASCAGLPIVATDIGGIADLEKLGVDVRLTRHGDVDDLASKMDEAASAYRAEYAGKRAALARSIFSIYNTAEKYQQLYEELTKQRCAA